MIDPTLQMVFVLGFESYRQTHNLPSYILKAAYYIIKCRTAMMGGHAQVCPDGHYEKNHYNSCKHRMCPLCAYIKVQQWLDKQKARILACDHYHVVFTIPHESNSLWCYNKKIMKAILMSSAKETVFELLGDKKYLGAVPGIIGALHTWTKTLLLHPHVHFLVTGGGLKDGKWIALTSGFLFPVRVACNLFRGKFRAAVLKALSKGNLVLPPDMTEQQLINLLNKLGRKKWNIKICEKYSHGMGVLTYLAKYLRGGPISNSRIVQIENGQVIFNVGRGKKLLMTLSIEEFIGRFIQHIPLPGQRLVCCYGLYASTKKKYLNWVRSQLGQGDVEQIKEKSWQEILEERFSDSIEKPWLCPVCGKRLITKPLSGDKSKPTEQNSERPPPLKLAA